MFAPDVDALTTYLQYFLIGCSLSDCTIPCEKGYYEESPCSGRKSKVCKGTHKPIHRYAFPVI